MEPPLKLEFCMRALDLIQHLVSPPQEILGATPASSNKLSIHQIPFGMAKIQFLQKDIEIFFHHCST